VGGIVAPDAAPGKPAPPPRKRCRRCGAEAETFENSCPHCGRSYGTSTGTVVAIVAGACVAAILLLGGCAVLIGLAVEEADEELDELGITPRQYRSIGPGTSERKVRDELGEPAFEDTLTSPALECLYYPEKGEGLLGIENYEFCFRNGRLYSKQAD